MTEQQAPTAAQDWVDRFLDATPADRLAVATAVIIVTDQAVIDLPSRWLMKRTFTGICDAVDGVASGVVEWRRAADLIKTAACNALEVLG